VSRLKVDRATDADFHQIVGDIVDFWGSDRTLRLHHTMYVHELADTSYVIKDGDRVIAYLFGLIAETKKVAYASLIGVRHSHRRQGLGERLYELFQEYARARGCTGLTAVTDPSNANSIAFHTGRIGMRCSIVKDYGGPAKIEPCSKKQFEAEGRLKFARHRPRHGIRAPQLFRKSRPHDPSRQHQQAARPPAPLHRGLGGPQ
jgi:GNAT superfamily N-acetyltransferase